MEFASLNQADTWDVAAKPAIIIFGKPFSTLARVRILFFSQPEQRSKVLPLVGSHEPSEFVWVLQ